jgi:hypothetical protein
MKQTGIAFALLVFIIWSYLFLTTFNKSVARELDTISTELQKSNLAMEREIKKQNLMLDILTEIVPNDQAKQKLTEIEIWYENELKEITQ